MMNLFANSSSNWVKYDKYEWKKADNGTLYITPTEDAKPSLYNPVKEYQDMVLAAINIGTLAMKEEPKESLQASIIDFACNYIKDHFEGVSVGRPEGTYMLFVDCTEWCKKHGKTIEDVEKAAWDVGVACQDGRMFHGPCHLRINLALPLSRVQEAFHRLDKYVFNVE